MRPSADSNALGQESPAGRTVFLALPDWRAGLSYLVCLIFFVSLSAGQGLVLGPVSVQVDEFIAGLAIVVLSILGEAFSSEKAWERRESRLMALAFCVIALWGFVLWLVGNNWRDRSPMILNWAVCGLLVYVLLVRVRLDWEWIAFVFALAAVPNSAVAIQQHFAGIGYGYKNLLGWLPMNVGGSKPAPGFFSFPNSMAAYLLWPFVISVGLAFQGSSIRRILSAVCVLLAGLALFWTYSRTAILTAGVALVLCVIISLARRRRVALLGLGITALVTAIGAAVILAQHPFSLLSSGRPVIWSEALRIIGSNRFLLAWGYLNTTKGPEYLSPWWVPHNIYLMLWMEFGVLGVAFLVGLLAHIVWLGWTCYGRIRQSPLLLASWGVLLAFFLVEGMATNDLLETFSVLTFASGMCILVGLLEQARPLAME